MLVAKQPLYQPQIPQRLPNSSKKKQRQAVISTLSRGDKALVVCVIVLVAALTLGLVWRFAQVNDLQYRITRLERQIARIDKANSELIIQVNGLSSPAQVEARAQQYLGMQWPTKKQIINVSGGMNPPAE